MDGEQRFATLGADFLGRAGQCKPTEVKEFASYPPERRREEKDKYMREKGYDLEGAEQGAVAPPTPGKTRITIRIDTDVLEWFRQQVHDMGGGNYQTLINAALRETMQARDETLESVLRKVIREELYEYRSESLAGPGRTQGGRAAAQAPEGE